MNRTLRLLATGAVLGASGMTFAHCHGEGESVEVISVQNIKEKLDGKGTKMTVVKVTLEPGQAGMPHRHPGPGFVYVLEGEYELGIDDQPTKVFKAGETFYEPTGCLHRVSKNPAAKQRTRLIAVVLHAATVNGEPGVVFTSDGAVVQVVSLCIEDGVRAVYMTLTPDKLSRWSVAEID